MKFPLLRKITLDTVPLHLVFIIPFSILILVTTLSVGYFSFINGQKAVNDVAKQLRNEIILRIQQHLGTILTTPQQINQMNEDDLQRGIMNPGSASGLQQHFLAQVRTFPTITSVYFGSANGGIAGSGRENVQGDLYVYNTNEMQPGIFNKYSVDNLGRSTTLLSTLPNFDARTRPWFLAASALGDGTWSSPYILFTGQDLAIAASQPVYNQQGQLLGVVSVDIFLSQLSDFLKTLAIGPGGQSFIIERSGLLVAASNGEKLADDLNKDGKLERIDVRKSTTASISQSALYIEKTLGAFENIKAQQLLEYQLDGQRQFLQLLPVTDQFGIDWIVVVVIPESVFMGQIESNNRATLVIIFLALITSLAVSVFITSKVSSRISQLNLAAQSLAQGKWDQRLETHSMIRELNGLTSSFNQMEIQLTSSLKNLQSEILEKKQAEETLRSYIEYAPIGVLLSDEKGTYLETNPAASKISGYAQGELNGMNILTLTPVEEHPEVARQFQKLLESGHSSSEFAFIHRTGEIKYWSVDAVKLSSSRFMGFVQEITERVRTNKMLNARLTLMDFAISHSLMELLQSTLDQVEKLTDSEVGFYHFVENDKKMISLQAWSTRTIQEYCKAEGNGQHYASEKAGVWADCVAEMRPVIHNDYASLPHRKGLPDGHAPLIRELVVPILRDGKVVSILGVGNKPNDYTESDVALVSYFADIAWEIAEHKRAEEDLAKSHTLLERLARLVPGVIYQYRLYPDGHSAFPYSSPGMKDIYEFSPEDVQEDATPVFSRLHPEDYQLVANSIQNSAQTLETFFSEFRVILPRQGLRWRWSQAHPERMSDGSTLWHGIISDITDQKLVESELRQHRDHLKELVSARTAELEIARDHAEAANHAKSDFLAVMSHEIRTPLNGVLGLAYLLKQTGVTEQQRNYLTSLQSSGESLVATINDILDFSKIESGKLTLELSNFNLDEVLDRISKSLAYRANEKGLELIFNTGIEVPRLMVGAPTRLEQVLVNLVGNAIKFTESGEIVVKTSLVEKTESLAVIEFSVRDTGIGMTVETISHLFEPFSQADSSTSRKYGGTGLGLTISQRLLQIMGSEMNVASQPDKGSEFTFHLKMDYLAKDNTDIPVLAGEIGARQVLVVDDNPNSLEALQNLLVSLSYNVTGTQSAREALTLLAERNLDRLCPFEFVLMDWSLPVDHNELEAIRLIKIEFQQLNIPIILMLPSEEMLPQIDKDGLDGILVKPIMPSNLINTLRQGKKLYQPQEFGFIAKPALNEAIEKLRGRHILLVEDNPINQLVAIEILRQMGLVVSLASNGEQAVQMAGDEHFDAILMDIQMPDMDGYEATRQIRQACRQDDIRLPIIAMTANALENDRQITLDAGLDDYLSKPVDVTRLTEVLLQWVKPSTESNNEAEATGASQMSETLPRPGLLEEGKELTVIDQIGALARLGNNKQLYQRLLILFQAEHAQDGDAIRTALRKKDLKLGRLLAHSLKGVAATIGATELQEAAKILENAVAEGNEPIYETTITTIEVKLAVILDWIAGLS